MKDFLMYLLIPTCKRTGGQRRGLLLVRPVRGCFWQMRLG